MGTTNALTGTGARAARPNFFIVGAPKCGTSAWHKYLRSHPQVYFPDLKEPCYFAFDLPSFRVVASEDEYAALFEAASEAAVIGDASAVHLMSEAAAQAIHEYNPAAKILILLRRQEDFLPSFHNQLLWEFYDELADFEQAWRLSGRRSADTIPPKCEEPRVLDYAAMGRFCAQVERYLDRFPANQVKVLWMEDWVHDPAAAYLEMLQFLGLEADDRSDFAPVHEGMSYRSRRLARFFVRPPQGLRNGWRLVKRLTGISTSTSLRFGERFLSLLAVPGYRKTIAPALRREIRDFYAADNARLRRRVSDRNSSLSAPAATSRVA